MTAGDITTAKRRLRKAGYEIEPERYEQRWIVKRIEGGLAKDIEALTADELIRKALPYSWSKGDRMRA